MKDLKEFEDLFKEFAPYGKPLHLAQDVKDAKIEIPETIPMSNEWKKNQKKMFWWGNPDLYNSKEFKQENELRTRLIEIGGENAAINGIDISFKNINIFDLIFNYGQLLYAGYDVIIDPFSNYNNCHISSKIFYSANKNSVKICTGYALSDDGLWREHSWIITKNKCIIERTHIRRLAYYGVVLPDLEA